MKKIKQLCAIAISVFMLVATIIPNIYTNAAGEFTVEGSSANCKAGENVSVDVKLKNNPGIAVINLYYTYDTEFFGLTSVENKAPFFIMTHDVTTVWDASSNYTEDSILATLNFAVAKDTPTGDYEIEIHVLEATNEDFQTVVAHTIAAKVSVEALPVATTGLDLNQNDISLVEGDSETLTATVTPDNATNKAVTWKSSDPTVATVDNNGKVTAIKKGTATITATTEDGGFTDMCEVSVACSHANTTTHTAVDSTCQVQGNNEYSTCDECGIVVSGSDEKLPFASHQLTNHPRNEANHTNAGNIEYWTCDICNTYFRDVAGKNEIEQKDTIIDKVPHSYETIWSYNETQHWKECGCGDKIELENHKYDNECDATCNDGCGYTRSITHQWKSSYATDDNKHWYECEICGEKKDEGNHSGGMATCKEKAMCEVCDKAYGKFASHSMTEKVDAAYLKSEANCEMKAVYYKSCSVCGVAGTETFETGQLDATNHTGETEIRDVVKATCTTDGYSGDTYCKDCGVKIKEGDVIPAGHDYGLAYSMDKDNHWKECACGDVIEKDSHNMSDWKISKEATKTAKGRQERSCSVCGYKETQDITMLKTDSPKTGDYNNAYIWIALLACSCIGVVSVIAKKKKY